ncbi:hypothetical protein Tco_0119177 [Tanacetum coccineum]
MATAGENFYSYFDRERREAAKLKVPPFTESGTTSTPKAPDNEEEENELKKSKLKKEPSWAPYSLVDLKDILSLSPENSELYHKTYCGIKRRETALCSIQSKSKKIPASLDNLNETFLEQQLRQNSKLYKKTNHRIKERREAAK